MMTGLNPLVRFVGSVRVGEANTRYRVGRENRIFYFTSGEAKLVVAGKTYPVSRNSLAYIPSYTDYRFELRAGDNVSLVCLNFDVSARVEHGEGHIKPIELSAWDGDRSDGEHLPEEFSAPIVISAAEGVLKDVNKLVRIFYAREPYYADFASLYMKKILLFVLTRSGVDPISEPAERILEYVRANYRNRIRNGELAKLFGYHPNHLNRVVKSYTGMTLKSYIIACKVAAAREQLASTDEPITEISESCGFSTPSYFTEIFSRSEGVTPREYRSRMRNVIV